MTKRWKKCSISIDAAIRNAIRIIEDSVLQIALVVDDDRLDGHQIFEIQEKSMQKFFVNAGIYAIAPKVLQLVLEDEYVDITTLLERTAKENWLTAVFSVRDYWLDIGRHTDFDRAQEFSLTFK